MKNQFVWSILLFLWHFTTIVWYHSSQQWIYKTLESLIVQPMIISRSKFKHFYAQNETLGVQLMVSSNLSKYPILFIQKIFQTHKAVNQEYNHGDLQNRTDRHTNLYATAMEWLFFTTEWTLVSYLSVVVVAFSLISSENQEAFSDGLKSTICLNLQLLYWQQNLGMPWLYPWESMEVVLKHAR